MFKKLFGGFMGSRPEIVSAPTFEQRRKTARRRCDLEVAAGHGRKLFSARVVDISVGGLRLHCSAPVGVKSNALLSLTLCDESAKAGQPTECLVRWTKLREADSSQFVGVQFKDQKSMGRSWVKAKMQEMGFQSYNLAERRTNFRVDCRIPATLEIGGGSVGCSVKNVGLGGFFVNLRQPIRAGATITLQVLDNPDLGDTSYTATLRHQQQADPADPFGYGCAFTGLTGPQAEAIKGFLVSQQQLQWERTSVYSDLLYENFDVDQGDEVVIPDLASILAENPEGEEEEL